MKRFFCALLIFVFSFSIGRGMLSGPMKDFFAPRPGDTTAIVFGTKGIPPALLKKIELLAYRNADFLKQKDPSRVVEVCADTAMPQSFMFSRSLVLMGSTRSHRLLAEWKELLPFLIKDKRFNIAGLRLYFGEDMTLSFVFPNPLANNRYVFGLVGASGWNLPSLSDWEGDYDYYAAQRHTFPKEFLNRGKFEKPSDSWVHTLADYEPSSKDTTVLVSLVYPYGKIWYPLSWELKGRWKDPIPDRIQFLASLQRLLNIFSTELGISPKGDIDFHLSEDYPQNLAADPMGRVFVKTSPEKIDSLAVYSWGSAVTKAIIPCSDAPLDWELFCHRYLTYETLFPPQTAEAAHQPTDSTARKSVSGDSNRGRRWLFEFTDQDSTYLSFLRAVDARYLNKKIGEALDSVTEGGRRYSFKMKDFVEVMARLTKDTTLIRLSKAPLRASPYDQKPGYELGIKNLGNLFLNREVILKEMAQGSKAYVAGLRRGDKLISVDGFSTSRNRCQAYLSWLGKKAGETLKLQIMRNGVKRTVAVPVG